MALLKKLNISAATQNVKFEDVKVPELGEDAEIRIQRLRVAGQIRLSELHKSVTQMDVSNVDVKNMLFTTASLMCVMVDEDGDYLVPGDDVKGTFEALDSTGVFFKLFTANGRVNAVNTEDIDKTLEDSKKNS